jgi:hypothetical protein
MTVLLSSGFRERLAERIRIEATPVLAARMLSAYVRSAERQTRTETAFAGGIRRPPRGPAFILAA